MIRKEMNIMEIIQKKPKSAEVMMEAGMHCIGCMAGRFESFEQGAKAHGFDDKQIDAMIEKINNIKDEDSKEEKNGKGDK